MRIPIDQIRPNPDQPRRHFRELALAELAESIRQDGIIVALLVRPLKEGYQIVHGERRWRAAKMAGLKELPCEVRQMNDVQSFYTSLAENIQRQDLNPVEEARAIKRLMELEGLSVRKAAKRIAKSAMYVSLKLKMLREWPEGLLEVVACGDVNEAVGRALYKLFTVWWDYDSGPGFRIRYWPCIWTALRIAGIETAQAVSRCADSLRYNLAWPCILSDHGKSSPNYEHYEKIRSAFHPMLAFLEAEGRWSDEMLWAFEREAQLYGKLTDEGEPGMERRTR